MARPKTQKSTKLAKFFRPRHLFLVFPVFLTLVTISLYFATLIPIRSAVHDIPPGYKAAQDLKAGDTVYVLKDGKLQETQITQKEKIDRPTTAYNLSVDTTQNFIADNFAVHNKAGYDITGQVFTSGTTTKWQSPSDKCGSQYPVYGPLRIRMPSGSLDTLDTCYSSSPWGPAYHFGSRSGTKTVSVISLPPGYSCGTWAYESISSGSGCTATITLAHSGQNNLNFRIKPPSPPPTPVPRCSSPASGNPEFLCDFSSGDLTVFWQWGAVSGATQYRLQIDDNSNFSSINYNVTTSSTNYTRSVPGRIWYARVRVEQSNSCIPPSGWRSLPTVSQTCGTVNTPTPTPTPTPTRAPTPTSRPTSTPTPAPSQCNAPSRPSDPPSTSCTSSTRYSATWEWNAVWDSAAGSWSTQYRLQVDNNSNFSSINYSTGWLSAATFGCASGGRCRRTTTNLTSGVRYYSRVMARGLCTQSNWSSTVSVYRSCAGPTPTPTTATCNFCGDTTPCSGTRVCDSAPGICITRLSRNQGDCDCNANCTTNFCYQRTGTDYCCNPGEIWETGVGCHVPVDQCERPDQPIDPPTSPCTGNTYSATWRWQAIWDPDAGDWSARYQVQVDTENTFTAPLFQDTNWLPASSFGCASGGRCRWTTSGLQSGVRYYSRLRAWGICDPSDWSNTVSVIKTCEGGVIGNIVDAGPGLSCSDLTSTPVTATVQATGPENLPPQTGTSFSYTNILPGTYNFSVSNPPAEYTTDGALYCESPTDPVPSSFVDVTSGSTANLTIGLVGNAAPWWQSQDGDILAQNVSSPIPAGCTPSAGCQPYISLIGNGGQPGVIAYQSSYNDGAGDPSASPYGWLVQQGAISTNVSYSQLLSRVSGQTQSIDSLVSGGQISGDILIAQVPNGETRYLTYSGGDLTIISAINADQRKLILFVSGNLTIQGNVNFANGRGLVGFISNGSIAIDRNINGGSAANPALEGIFFAQNQFITRSAKDAAPPSNDNTLYIRGSVVGVNGINFRRDLDYDNSTSANNTQPAEVVIFAPDLLFTFPQALRGKEFIWEQIPS